MFDDHIFSVLVQWGFWATVLQLLIVAGVVLRVISTRHPPGSSFAWILLTFALPYIGFILYLILGERPVGKIRAWRYRRLISRWRRQFAQWPSFVAPAHLHHHQHLLKLAARCGNMRPSNFNDIKLLGTPEVSFAAILQAIQDAQHSIDMTFYIWHDGGYVQGITEALKQANARGVRVRILVDAFGSSPFLKSQTCQTLQNLGIEIADAMPVGLLKTFGLQRADLRLHRKLVIVDQKIAFTGSLNMIDPSVYPDAKVVGNWVDAMVRLEGPAVSSLAILFQTDWLMQPDHESQECFQLETPQPSQGQATVVCVPSGPNAQTLDPNLHLILEAIHTARHTLTITTPYFVPNESLVNALLNACYRGVEVTLIVPEHGNNRAVTYASRRYFDDLLQAGATIKLFNQGLLHTKSLLIDNEFVVFGTVNLDNRSLHLNYELMLLLFDATFVDEFAKLVEGYQAHCHCVHLGDWRTRPWRVRLLEGACFLLSPLL